MTQEQRLLEYLQNGNTITVAEAPLVLGIGSLTRRITSLRRSGHNILAERVKKESRFGGMMTYNKYYMGK